MISNQSKDECAYTQVLEFSSQSTQSRKGSPAGQALGIYFRAEQLFLKLLKDNSSSFVVPGS